MMPFRFVRLAALAAAVASAGCYKVTVVANEAPTPSSAATVDKPFAHSFVYGLVPPAPVETAKKCPGGVQQVVTQRSFLNSLVASLTWNLYTPVQITATCASSRIGLRSSAPPARLAEALAPTPKQQ